MTALAIYILKVIICSALLTGYYFIALRNKFFHQWNRFYLLVAVLLSITIPLFEFTIFNEPVQKNAIDWLQYISSGEELVVGLTNPSNGADLSLWPVYAYSFIVSFLFISLCFSLYKLWMIIRKYPSQKIQNIRFINSDTKGTPFSFFQCIFWNPAVDINTTTGQQVFKHELIHIREGHTIDKLIMQIVLALFWCNPFFWLIRYELRMIHEFIADKKATERQDVSQLAAMILQTAYPKYFNQIISPFFHLSIKRRLAMLTKQKNPRVTYISRIVALPLIAFTILSFAVKVKEIVKDDVATDFTLKQENQIINDTIPDKKKKNIESINIKEKDVEVVYKDGTKETLNANEAYKRGLIEVAINESTVNLKGLSGGSISITEKKLFPGLVMLNGEIYNGKLDDITPESIQSINVLKDEPALKKYGDKGKNGVIEIILKETSLSEIKRKNREDKNDTDTIPKNMGEVKRIEFLKDGKAWIFFENGLEITTWQEAVNKDYITRGKADELINDVKIKKHPLIIVNGKEEPSFTESSLYIYNNESGVEMIKLSPGEAIKKYGTKGTNGAIEITNDQKPYQRIFTKTEVPPTFPGGADAWQKFLTKNLNAAVPVEKGAPSGTYAGVAKFIVDVDGSISDITAVTTHGYGLEEEIIKLMSLSPKWIPAMQNNRPVKAYHKQTVTFVVAAGN